MLPRWSLKFATKDGAKCNKGDVGYECPAVRIAFLREVVRRKFPAKETAIDNLLSHMSYELVYTPQHMEEGLFSIRDEKDYPVLYTAIVESVDILITGDKDFAGIEIDKPEILTPSGFLELHC